MVNASRDENNVPTLLGASSADGTTPVRVYANPTTHRLLVDATPGVTGPGSSIDNDIVVFDGTTGQTIKDSNVTVTGPTGVKAILDFSAVATSDKTITFANASGTVALKTSASGSFTSQDGKTITVVNGVITSIV